MDDTLTITPPAPPWRVLMRRTASRAQWNAPPTLTANTRAMRAGSISSTRAAGATMPALLTRPPSGPRASSHWRNIAATASARATSAGSSSARRPSARTASTTCCAAASSLR
jgi:hypothetical protein